jgi:hypothetical protein
MRAADSGRVPRVARGLECRVLRGTAHGELVHIGLADQHCVGGLEPGDDGGVERRPEVRQDSRGARGRLALRAKHILDGHGQAAQPPHGLASPALCVDLGRAVQGRLAVHAEEGADLPVVLLDLAEEGRGSVHRRSLAAAEPLEELRGRQVN